LERLPPTCSGSRHVDREHQLRLDAERSKHRLPTDPQAARKLQNGAEAERTAYTPPQRGVVHRVIGPRHADEEPDNTRTQERESSRTVIQPMSRNAPIARSLPRRKPQAARTGGKKHSDRATVSPPGRKPASHRTTIINRSIIVL